MNQGALNKLTEYQEPICSDLLTMAEQELAAFFNAVAELFGAEQAEVSAKNWLNELAAIKNLPASPRQWRQLTVKAAARFATVLRTQPKGQRKAVGMLVG